MPDVVVRMIIKLYIEILYRQMGIGNGPHGTLEAVHLVQTTHRDRIAVDKKIVAVNQVPYRSLDPSGTVHHRLVFVERDDDLFTYVFQYFVSPIRDKLIRFIVNDKDNMGRGVVISGRESRQDSLLDIIPFWGTSKDVNQFGFHLWIWVNNLPRFFFRKIPGADFTQSFGPRTL